LILVAESFSEYDKYAVNRIGANIELWTYRKYGDNLLYLDPLFVAAPQPTKGTPTLQTIGPEEDTTEETPPAPIYTLEDHLARKPQATIELFEQLRERILALGEEGEIVEKSNKMYIGYSHGKNFCEVRIQQRALVIWLDISPDELDDPYNLIRDVTNIGHYGTGASEVRLKESDQTDRIVALIEQSYKQTV
jgi:predicted transport protein